MASFKLSPIRYGILAATSFTAVVHLLLAAPLFILNGLGYLVLLLALFLPALSTWHSRIRWLLIGYTIVTIAAYFITHADGSWQMDGLGLMTKVAEVILLLLLLFEMQPPLEPTE